MEARGQVAESIEEATVWKGLSPVSITLVIQVVAAMAVSIVALAAFAYGSTLGYRRGVEASRRDGLPAQG